MAITRRQPCAMIDVDNIAVAALSSGDRDASAAGSENRIAVFSVDVLSFVILESSPTKRIAPATEAAFQSSVNRPK